MKKVNATHHARKRMQQRAINDTSLLLIETFGERQYQKGGTYHSYVSKKQIDCLRKAIDKLNTIGVIYDETDKVITTFHQTKKTRSTEFCA